MEVAIVTVHQNLPQRLALCEEKKESGKEGGKEGGREGGKQWHDVRGQVV